MTRPHIAGLDALRGVAALVVLAHHMELKSSYDTQWMLHGYLAVDLFFMLSGFVIGLAYEPRMAAGLRLSEYAHARLVRLYPIIALGAVAGFGVTMADDASAGGALPPWLGLAMQLLFVPALWAPGGLYPFNGAQWSLFFELVVNFLHATAAKFLTNGRLVAVVVLGALSLFLTAYHAGSLAVGFERSTLGGGLVRTVFSFFTGLLLYRIWVSRPDWRTSLPWPLLLLALPLVVALAGHERMSWRWYLDPLLVLTVFPLLIWMGASISLRGPVASAALWLGAISYPCYALQWPVRQAGTLLLAGQNVPEPLKLAILAGAVLLVSWLAAKFYDPTARRSMDRALLRLSPKPASAR